MVYKIIYHKDQQGKIDCLLADGTFFSTKMAKDDDKHTMYVHDYPDATVPIAVLENEFNAQFNSLDKYCVEFIGKQRKLLKWDGVDYKYVKFISVGELVTLRALASENSIKLVFIGDVVPNV